MFDQMNELQNVSILNEQKMNSNVEQKSNKNLNNKKKY